MKLPSCPTRKKLKAIVSSGQNKAAVIRRAYIGRLRFHFTPAHASWLNMAEVEFSVLSGQCLSRRIADDWTLRFQIAAWENARNARKAQIRWKFTTEHARKVFKQYYPTSLES